MKEAVTKVIDMLMEEDFHGAFQQLLSGATTLGLNGPRNDGNKEVLHIP